MLKEIDDECIDLVKRALKDDFKEGFQYIEQVDAKDMYSSKNPNAEGLSGADQVRSVLQRYLFEMISLTNIKYR